MKFWPQWTRRVAMDGSGRDPLGLSRVSDALTNFLLPNIITTTDRARYYSFYTWAADIEALRKSNGRRISFEEEFQRREAAFALASRIGQKVTCQSLAFDKWMSFSRQPTRAITWTRIARIPTRLACMDEKLQMELINWGYAACEASLMGYFPHSGPQATWPYASAPLV